MNQNHQTEQNAGPSSRSLSSKKVVKWLMDKGEGSIRIEYDSLLQILRTLCEDNEYLKMRFSSAGSAGDSQKLLYLDREVINTLNKSQQKLADVVKAVERLKQQEIQDQEVQKDEMKKEEDKWKKRLRKAEAEISALKRDVIKYESWYNEQKLKNDEPGGRVNELDVTRKRYEGVCSRLQALESQLSIIGDARKTDLSNMMALEGSFASSERNLSSLTDQVYNLMWQKQCDEETKKRLVKEKQDAEKELKLKQQFNIQLEKEISLVHDTINSTQEKLKAMKREKAQMSLKLTEKQSEIEILQKNIEAKEILLRGATKMKDELEDQLEITKDSLSKTIVERLRTTEALQKAETEKTELSERNAAAERRIKEMMDQLFIKDGKIEKMEGEINGLSQELKSSLEDLKNTYAMNEVNQEQLLRLDEDKVSLEMELSIVNESVKSLNRTVTVLTSQKTDLQNEFEEKKSEIEFLSEKTKILEGIKEAGKKMCQETVNAIRNLQIDNTELSDQMMMEDDDYLAMSEAMAPFQNVTSSNVYDRALVSKAPLKAHSWHIVEELNMSKHEMIKRSRYLVKKLMIQSRENTILGEFLNDKAALLDHFKDLTMKYETGSICLKESKRSDCSLDDEEAQTCPE